MATIAIRQMEKVEAAEEKIVDAAAVVGLKTESIRWQKMRRAKKYSKILSRKRVHYRAKKQMKRG